MLVLRTSWEDDIDKKSKTQIIRAYLVPALPELRKILRPFPYLTHSSVSKDLEIPGQNPISALRRSESLQILIKGRFCTLGDGLGKKVHQSTNTDVCVIVGYGAEGAIRIVAVNDEASRSSLPPSIYRGP